MRENTKSGVFSSPVSLNVQCGGRVAITFGSMSAGTWRGVLTSSTFSARGMASCRWVLETEAVIRAILGITLPNLVWEDGWDICSEETGKGEEYSRAMWGQKDRINRFFHLWNSWVIRALLLYVPSCAQSLSRVWLFVTPWTAAHQAPLSIESSRQDYRSRLPFPTPGDLPNPGMEPESLVSPVLAGGFFTTVPPGKPYVPLYTVLKRAYIFLFFNFILFLNFTILY